MALQRPGPVEGLAQERVNENLLPEISPTLFLQWIEELPLCRDHVLMSMLFRTSTS